MRFFSVVTSILTFAACAVNAQNNPLAITSPLGGSYAAGNSITITWTPTPAGKVTMVLRYGNNMGNLATGDPIASAIDNSGSFLWNIPLSLASFSYTIQIVDTDGVSNYSPIFQITGGQGALSTASTSAASTPITISVQTATSTSVVTGITQVTRTSTQITSVSQTGAPNAGSQINGAEGSFAAVLGLAALVIMT